MAYPNHSRAAVIECPVHHCSVSLGEDGRIASACSMCATEARRAIWRWQTRRRRARAVA